MIKNMRRSFHEEKLPWEMIEEILSYVPPKSLVCFKTVSKKWNALFDDTTFLKNHKSTFRFVLATNSKFYSVSIIDLEIVVRELTLDIPGLETDQTPRNLVDCGDFLLIDTDKGAVVWNPWLKHTRMIKSEPAVLYFEGISYDSNKSVKESGYKTMAWKVLDDNKSCWTIHDLATDTWKDRESSESSDSTNNQGRKSAMSSGESLSLNGNMYWVSYYVETNPLHHLHKFDFSSEKFFKICDLPCLKNHPQDALVLGVYKRDRLSLLKQCHVTKKIEIWVTKNNDNDVVWMSFMQVSVPNLPDLVHMGSDSSPSYCIDDKRLVVCCCDETGRAWIYIMEENKLIKKFKIESVVDHWPLHCTYFPSLVPVPQGAREEAELQV